MDLTDLRRRVAATRIAPVAAFPVRMGRVASHSGRVAGQSLRWLVSSREHTNLTYDLTDLNREHLAWFVADVVGSSVETVRGHLAELDGDWELRQHIEDATAASARRGLADREVRYGRRLGWYALVRGLRPDLVVETGTDKGLGSCVLAAALLRNGSGELLTIDVNPGSGYLVDGKYAEVVDRRLGSSLEVLAGRDRKVDMFLHDSDHSPGYEAAELTAVAPHLDPAAVVLSDNAHMTDELLRWAEEDHSRFRYFAEQPADHVFPGGGSGAAVRQL